MAEPAAASAEPQVRRRGAVIVVAGPDGSGKSTVAAAVVARLGSDTLWLHHRPRLLPARGGDTGRPVTDPYGRSPYPAVVSAAKVVYYFLDYQLGWALRVRPAQAAGAAVVLERGWWDLAVDPRRYRLRGVGALVALLGRLIPRPLRTVVLDAPADVLLARTQDNLSAADLEAQRAALRRVHRERPATVFLDATKPVTALVTAVVGDSGVPAAPPPGLVGLPSAARARWYVPPGSRAARGGLRIYTPVTPRGLAAWHAARLAAGAGAFRLLSPAQPPAGALDLITAWVPPGGSPAVAVSNHVGRCHALTLDHRGRPAAHVKVATDPPGQEALAREAAALEEVAPFLVGPVRAPRVLHHERGLLVTEGVAWTPVLRPWRLDPRVARSLGQFARAGAAAPGAGAAHGDVAPWNLLRRADEWVLVDWEMAQREAVPFFDLLHWLVGTHALLGRPRRGELLQGLRGAGWIGECVRAYAQGAGLATTGMRAHLVTYLDATAGRGDATAATARREAQGRRGLRQAAVTDEG